MYTAEARARLLTYNLGSASEACSADPVFCGQKDNSILRIHFRKKIQSLIFATVTCFELRNQYQQQMLRLGGEAGTPTGARSMKKMNTALRRERGAELESRQQ